VVIIDPGHGGTDSGATYKERVEKNINLHVALSVYAFLCNSARVMLTRLSDRDVSLQERVYLSMRQDAEMFVSIHANADPDDDTNDNLVAEGAEIFVYPKGDRSRSLGRSIGEELRMTALGWRGIKDGSHLYVVKNTRCPAVLVEIGFIDNPHFDTLSLQAVGGAIARGVVKSHGGIIQ
jgi:N-acetylmuramoyl-L-alanine amidase